MSTKRFEVTLFDGYTVFINAPSPAEAWVTARSYCPEELVEEHEVPAVMPA